MADHNRNGSRCSYQWPGDNFDIIQGQRWFLQGCKYPQSSKMKWVDAPDLQGALDGLRKAQR